MNYVASRKSVRRITELWISFAVSAVLAAACGSEAKVETDPAVNGGEGNATDPAAGGEGGSGSKTDAMSDARFDGSSDGSGIDDDDASDATSNSDGGPDGGGVVAKVCDPHSWKPAVVAPAGSVMMAFDSKSYLFAADGLTWSVTEDGVVSVQPIPRPAGVAKMFALASEMAPSNRPLVTFFDGAQVWAAIFDGSAFVKASALGQVTAVHADAAEHFYAVDASGLVEVEFPGAPVFRGSFPQPPKAWTVAADGSVYALWTKTIPATDERQLRSTRLLHGAATWTDDVLVGSNNGGGFSTVAFAAAPDGSLHVAYVPFGIYFRSRNGLSWQEESFVHFSQKATLVDVVTPGIDGVDPAYVTGNPRLVAAQDFDHASITLVYNGGSLSRPSYYFLRRCAPAAGTQGWPAERLGLPADIGFSSTPAAVNQSGIPTIRTQYGIRQDVP